MTASKLTTKLAPRAASPKRTSKKTGGVDTESSISLPKPNLGRTIRKGLF